MCGVTQRIQNGRDLHGHVIRNANHIALRDAEVLREATGTIHAHALGIRAEVEEPAAAVVAVPADDVPLAGHDIAGLVGLHRRAHALHDTAELMTHVHTHGNGLLRPGIPVPNMQIRTADSGLVNLNEDIIRADFRHRHLHQLQPLIGLRFDERFHARQYIPDRPRLQA